MKTRMITPQSNNQPSHTLGLYAKYAKATHNSHSQPVPLLDQHGIANLLGNLTPHQRLHHSQCKLKAGTRPPASDDRDDNDRLSLPLPIATYSWIKPKCLVASHAHSSQQFSPSRQQTKRTLSSTPLLCSTSPYFHIHMYIIM